MLKFNSTIPIPSTNVLQKKHIQMWNPLANTVLLLLILICIKTQTNFTFKLLPAAEPVCSLQPRCGSFANQLMITWCTGAGRAKARSSFKIKGVKKMKRYLLSLSGPLGKMNRLSRLVGQQGNENPFLTLHFIFKPVNMFYKLYSKMQALSKSQFIYFF